MRATANGENNTDTRTYSYVNTCIKCSKEYRAKSRAEKRCYRCRKEKRVHKYPRIFYYNKLSVYARDEFHCQLCDKELKNEKRNPPVHHIDGNIKNNNLTNLVTLCSQCHVAIHKKYTTEQLQTYNFHQLFKIKHYVEVKQEPLKKREKPLYFKNI